MYLGEEFRKLSTKDKIISVLYVFRITGLILPVVITLYIYAEGLIPISEFDDLKKIQGTILKIHPANKGKRSLAVIERITNKRYNVNVKSSHIPFLKKKLVVNDRVEVWFSKRNIFLSSRVYQLVKQGEVLLSYERAVYLKNNSFIDRVKGLKVFFIMLFSMSILFHVIIKVKKI